MKNTATNAMTTPETMTSAAHPFERAGLGLAPFRIVGCEIRTITVGFGENSYTRAGSSCMFCFTAIAECWLIKSSDGKRFHVGCDCVRKTKDRTLTQTLAHMKTQQRNVATDARIESARAVFAADYSVQTMLQMMPAGRSDAFELVAFLFRCGGRKGQLRAAKLVEGAKE